MKNKYIKLIINIIILILNLGLVYILLVYSIFLLWGKHEDKELSSWNIIGIAFILICMLILVCSIMVFINTMKIVKNMIKGNSDNSK